MAKNKYAGADSAGAAVAEREKRVSQRSGDGFEGGAADGPAGTRNDAPGVAGGIYKPGQGYNTRMWTAIGFGSMIVWFIAFIWQKLTVLETNPKTTLIIQVCVSVAVLALFAILGYRLLGRNRKICDFMIATEGEMKKVNWTTRKEIIGSTKVVIFVLVAMSILLFCVDIIFMLLFSWMGVLKGRGMLDVLFGGAG